MEALGIPRGSYVVKVNNRKVLDGVRRAIGIGGDECGRWLTVLRAIDKLDRLGVAGVQQLLGRRSQGRSPVISPRVPDLNERDDIALGASARSKSDRAD